jgi:hypothetical protein
MIARTFAIVALIAPVSFAAPKQRAWEDGRVLDARYNPYFAAKDVAILDSRARYSSPSADFSVTQNGNGASNVVYDDYAIEGQSAAYLVELGHLKDYPAAHVTVWKPVRFAAEKSKLWLLDERGQEYETKIIKMVPRPGSTIVTQVQTPAPAPQPAHEQEPVKPALVQEPIVVAKAEVKEAPAVVNQALKSDRVAAKPAPSPAAPASANAPKDRPWQSGQLRSTAANPFFANIAYTTETDAATWTFVLGADGKVTAFIHAAAPQNSSYIYDNYVIETEFCGYLVQRARLKTAPPVRFPAAKSLKFAIEKTKIWIIDEDGREYEAKIVKQIQKDSEGIAETLARAAAL